jgi:hypothetical protein
MNFTIPTNITTKDELFKYLKDNKSTIIQEKKSANKKCDVVSYQMPLVSTKGDYESKEVAMTTDNIETGFVLLKFVGNTTNLLDSHMDVHIPKLWNKTLADNEYFLHLQEHEMEFDKVIDSKMKCSVKNVKWKSLGAPYEGSTQALFGESLAPVDRNEYMVEQYKKGYVTNHSVGMRYKNVVMCVNSEEKYYVDEKANWDKYYPMVANKEKADECGYFFAVLEAELIEISAVVKGSNTITPTISVTESKVAGSTTTTNIEPVKSTQKKVDYSKLKFI